jgi:heme-degrading monooxygenase HmoA
MILEVAILNIVPNQTKVFEVAFDESQKIISSKEGYIGHELQMCLENENQHILLVRWESLRSQIGNFQVFP